MIQLTDLQQKVYEALTLTFQTASEIAERAGVNKDSAVRTLVRLRKHKLCEQTTTETRGRWAGQTRPARAWRAMPNGKPLSIHPTVAGTEKPFEPCRTHHTIWNYVKTGMNDERIGKLLSIPPMEVARMRKDMAHYKGLQAGRAT